MSKYKIYKTKKFTKDYNKMKKRNNFDEKEFIKVVSIISNGEELPQKYCNHILEPKSERILWMPHKAGLVNGISIRQRYIDININQNWKSFWFVLRDT